MGNQISEVASVQLTLLRPLITREGNSPMTDADYTTTPRAKRCSKCGREYPCTSEYFYRTKGTKSGLHGQCKSCYNKMCRDWQSANREHFLEQQKQYRAENADRERARHQRYQSNNREIINEVTRRYRARRRALPNTFSKEQVAFALDYWQHKCTYCGALLPPQSKVNGNLRWFDHFIPVDDPRSDNPGTVATNMIPSCAKCNSAKGDFDPAAWISRQFGEEQAATILEKIAVYFASLPENNKE